MLYIDYSISLPEYMPKGLKEETDLLEQYYEEKNKIEYWCQLDVVEFMSKSYNLNGKISEGDVQKIFRRYGFA